MLFNKLPCVMSCNLFKQKKSFLPIKNATTKSWQKSCLINIFHNSTSCLFALQILREHFFLSMSSFCSFSWHCYCYRMVNKSTEWVLSTEKYFLQLILLFMRKVSYSFDFGGCVATIEILLIIYEVKSHKPHHNFSIFLSFLMQNNFIFISQVTNFFNKLAFCELFKFLIFFSFKKEH